MTWDQFNSAFSGGGSSSGRALGQFKGFDNHFFHYDKKTGDFYVPYTNNTINPADVLSGKIDWYSSLAMPLPSFSSELSQWNTTINDPPFPADNTIETLLIPIPPIFKAIKGIKAARGIMKFPGKYSTKAPKGFEWRGRPGSKPGSKNGN